MRRIALAGLAVLVVGALNWAGWQSARAPEPPAATGTGGLSWASFAAITATGATTVFPPELAARDGAAVDLTGVLFVLPQLTDQGRMGGAVLAPPAKFSCCGLSCEARSQSLVFVVPRAGTADPGRRRLARVAGTLHLHPASGHWSAVELTDAVIDFLPDP